MIGAQVRASARMVVKRAPPPDLPLRLPIALTNPVGTRLEEYARINLREAGPAPEMVKERAFLGQRVAICGAGPSLRKYAHLIEGVDQVWACNSALPFLAREGVQVHAGVGIDQTPGLLQEWADPPDVTYYLATTCDPELVRHLRKHDRRIVWFHNLVGWDGELDFYRYEWPPAFMVADGATVLPRSIGLLAWLGFVRVDVYGGDSCIVDDLAHANGEGIQEAYGEPLLMRGEIDGHTYITRPDMLMAAVDLARKTIHGKGRIRLIGDTLPVRMIGHDEDYLNEVMRRLAPGEEPHTRGESTDG